MARPAEFLEAQLTESFKEFGGKDFFPAKEFLSWTIRHDPEEIPDGDNPGLLSNAIDERNINV